MSDWSDEDARMVTQRIERMVGQVRQWRASKNADPLTVGPTLGEADIQKLRGVIDECVSDRGGEIAARRRATAIAGTFLELNATGRRNFFRLLADHYDHDDGEVDRAIERVRDAPGADERRVAERELAISLRPKRERLLRRFVGLDGGLQFLVDLREEMLPYRKLDSALTALDEDMRSLLDAWVDIALLELRRITWDTSAALLEKLIEYEAVHAIESWDDMRGRLGPLRRCYAYLHPMMPGEPLIFVEVALTEGIAGCLADLLDHDAERRSDTARIDTAIFYSISNCQTGLRGVSLGNFLIKRVVEELTAELPHLKTFATLSPIPGFRQWVLDGTGDENTTSAVTLSPSEKALISPQKPADAEAQLFALASRPGPPDDDELDRWEPILMRLAAIYLVDTRRGDRAFDPVAHFHLSNGARVEQLNWRANPGQTGWERGLSIMVNYRYTLDKIEANHDQYVSDAIVARSDEVDKLRGDAT